MQQQVTINTNPPCGFTLYPSSSVVRTYGLSKREYFAGQAIIGMLQGRKLSESPDGAISRKAVKLADALIDALNKE